MFLVFVGGPDWGGVEEFFNLREGGRERIVGGRGRGRGREGARRRGREGGRGREGKKSGM